MSFGLAVLLSTILMTIATGACLITVSRAVIRKELQVEKMRILKTSTLSGLALTLGVVLFVIIFPWYGAIIVSIIWSALTVGVLHQAVR